MQCLRRQLLPVSTTRMTIAAYSRLQGLGPLRKLQPGSETRELFGPYIGRRAESSSEATEHSVQPTRKKRTTSKRSEAGKNSLRRVAVEAQISTENKSVPSEEAGDVEGDHTITAISVADGFDMGAVASALRSHGFQINPDGTNFETNQLIHTRGTNDGDIFVFPSGTVVVWSLPSTVAREFATTILKPATIGYDDNKVEMENLEYEENPHRDNSTLRGDIILLGTKKHVHKDSSHASNDQVDITYAKIAFSSGLARSTKLAVLESMLRSYFEKTRHIPMLLSQGQTLAIDRQVILRRTGELLELRAQLNHYSELTDSLPDLFWDSRHELGLESYYDQIGRVLDVGVRIKTLNQKMDYAQEIASILRQYSSEKHGTKLEWIIIVLIAVEVLFGLRQIWKEYDEKPVEDEAPK